MRTRYGKKAIVALNHESYYMDKSTLEEYGFNKFKMVKGVYKGQAEHSFVVPYETESELIRIIEMAKSRSQESILLLDEDNMAKLLFLESGETEKLGEFKSVSRTQATERDSYTYDFINDIYYVTV